MNLGHARGLRAPARLRLAALGLLAALVLVGCASVGEIGSRVGGMVRGTEPAPPAPLPPQSSPPASSTPAPAARPGGSGAAMVGAPARLNLSSSCSARDEAGYAESIRLQVAEGRVQELQARIEVPRRGACTFQLADFHQTREAPHVELASRSGSACAVRMWEQQGRLTVAFSECHDKCSRNTFEYIWPIQLRAADGACS